MSATISHSCKEWLTNMTRMKCHRRACLRMAWEPSIVIQRRLEEVSLVGEVIQTLPEARSSEGMITVLKAR